MFSGADGAARHPGQGVTALASPWPELGRAAGKGSRRGGRRLLRGSGGAGVEVRVGELGTSAVQVVELGHAAPEGEGRRAERLASAKRAPRGAPRPGSSPPGRSAARVRGRRCPPNRDGAAAPMFTWRAGGSGCHAIGGCSGAPGAAAGGGVAAGADVGAAGSSSPVSGFTSAIARRERRYCPMASSC